MDIRIYNIHGSILCSQLPRLFLSLVMSPRSRVPIRWLFSDSLLYIRIFRIRKNRSICSRLSMISCTVYYTVLQVTNVCELFESGYYLLFSTRMISQSLLIAKLDCKVCETAICNFHLISLILKLMLTLPCTILMHMHCLYNCWVHGHSLMVISKELDQTSSIMGEPILVMSCLVRVFSLLYVWCFH